MSMDAKSVVRLEAEEQEKLGTLIAKGGRAAAVLKRVRVLLKADQSDAGGLTKDEPLPQGCEACLAEWPGQYNLHAPGPRLVPADYEQLHGPIRTSGRLIVPAEAERPQQRAGSHDDVGPITETRRVDHDR